MFDADDVIDAYGRSQAIDDGELVDVSAVAREAGFRYPVALSRGAWTDYVALPPDYRGCQDEAGRLWDVVWMTRYAIGRAPAGDTVRIELRVRPVKPDGTDASMLRRVHLVAICGPGDNAEPVITIMRPEDE